MVSPSPTYEPRQPDRGVLYQVVREHFETFREQAAGLRDGEGLPDFVEQEFRDFLRCGWLGGGFARFRCACGFERLTPFSCKGRGFCPSCCGRRMTERAAHLVDEVFPHVPVRQWVLSLPLRLRYRLAWDHDLCRAVMGRALHAILGFLRRRARAAGIPDGRSGAVAIVQRFGGALNLNVHLHALVLDGVFTQGGDAVDFHANPLLDAGDVADVLATVEAYVTRLLAQRGEDAEDAGGGTVDRWAEDAPVLAGLAAAAVQGRVALGDRAGARVHQDGDPLAAAPVVPRSGRCHARHNGFDLHAELCVPADRRDRLERLCRYVLRPPVAQDRFDLTADGHVRLTLKRPWANGTTHLEFKPLDLLARLAALTPRPRINLVLYHGVLAPRAAWRALVVRFDPAVHPGPEVAVHRDPEAAGALADVEEQAPGAVSPPPADNHHWAELMRRSFGIDVLACPRCGGRLALIAIVEDPAVIGRILRHLGLQATIPEPCPARSPPLFLAS